MTLEELLAMAKSAKETPLPDDYADNLETSVLMAMESRDETIEKLEREKGTLSDKVKTYAVENLELMRKAPSTTEHEEKEVEKTPMQLRREARLAFEKELEEL